MCVKVTNLAGRLSEILQKPCGEAILAWRQNVREAVGMVLRNAAYSFEYLIIPQKLKRRFKTRRSVCFLAYKGVRATSTSVVLDRLNLCKIQRKPVLADL